MRTGLETTRRRLDIMFGFGVIAELYFRVQGRRRHKMKVVIGLALGGAGGYLLSLLSRSLGASG